MSHRALLFAGLFVLLLAAAPVDADIVLTVSTPAKTGIVIPNDAGAGLKIFATLLQTRIEQALGRKLPILKQSTAGRLDLAFNVGPTAACLAALPDQDKLPSHGYEIKSDGKGNVYFAAKDDFAVGFAVTEFAEQILNVRQYMPAPLGVCFTRTSRVVIPAGYDYISRPDYASVWLSGVNIPGRDSNIVKYKEMDLALQTYWSDQFHHAMHDIFPPTVYGKTHPEYYPERDGQRVVPLTAQGKAINSGWQPCLSNPEVRAVALQYCLDYFKKNPAATSVSIAINDGGGYCQCDKCLAKEKELGGFSGLYFDFANQIAREVQQRLPGKKVGFLRYGEVNTVPTFPIEKNVLIYDVHPGSNDLTPWARKGASLGVYTWLYGFNYVTPRYFPHEFQRYMKLWKEQGATGFYGEAYPNWIVDAPMVYAVSKIARHLDADPEALLQQYATDMFGPAAPDIVQFYHVTERAMERRKAQKVDTFEAFSEISRPIVHQFKCWRVEDVKEMDDALAAAAAKVAPGSIEAQRLDLLRTWWSWGRGFILAYATADLIAQKPIKTAADVEALVPMIDQVTAYAADTAKQWETNLRDIDKGPVKESVGIYMRNDPNPANWQALVGIWIDPTIWPTATIDNALSAARQSLAATTSPADLAALFKGLAAKHPSVAPYFITQASLSAGEVPNIVTNPSFEEIDATADKEHVVPQGYKLMMSKSQYQKDVGIDEGMAHSGKRSFRFGDGGGAWLDRTVAVQPGARYLIRVWVRNNNARTDDRMNFLVLDKNDKLTRVVYNLYLPGEIPANEWHPFEGILTIPDNCEKLSIDIYSKEHDPGDATWFDDLYVGRVY